MKSSVNRIIAVFVVLITLSACTQNTVPMATERLPTVTEVPSPAPTPTPIPDLTPSHTPVALPDYFPPTDFEVASVWKAETFGDEGGALIFMSDIVDGSVSFKLYMYQYVCGQDSIDRWMNLSTITATAKYDGVTYTFSADQGYLGFVGMDNLVELVGTISFSADSMALEYTDAAYQAIRGETTELQLTNSAPSIHYEDHEWSMGTYTTFLPVTFVSLPENDAVTIMYDMPMFLEEVQLSSSTIVWQDGRYSSGDPDQIPMLRNVTLGNDIFEVISRFRCELEDYDDIITITPGNGNVMLYGGMPGLPATGRIIYEDAIPKEIRYVYGGEWISFFLDEKFCVSEIRFTIGA